MKAQNGKHDTSETFESGADIEPPPVQYIYENTMPGSGMRKLLRERLTLGLFKGRQHNPVTAEWREIMNETPDLGFDIVSEIASYSWIAGGNAPSRAVADKCAYHRHDRSEACVILF